MSMVVQAIIQKITELLLADIKNQCQAQVQPVLNFRSHFEEMKKQLILMKAFLNDTENLNNKKETLKACLFELRELFNEADDVVTDCIIRNEYQKDGSCQFYNTYNNSDNTIV